MTFSALLRTIVDDCDLWLDGANEGGVVAGIDAMMIDLENIHRADNVLRTCQTIFDVPGQIAAIKKSETTKRKQNADALGIVAGVFGLRFEILSTGSNLRRTDCSPRTMPLGGETRTLSSGEFFGDLCNLISSPGFRVVELPPVVCL